MNLIDKYIYAIGEKLPVGSREEIKKELKSLLLDELEISYGPTPTDEQIEKVIYEFGSPTQVAQRYKNNNPLIASKFTEIYLMISKIIIFAMTVAFFVIFVINFLKNDFLSTNTLNEVFKLIKNIITSSFTGIGVLTIIFMAISKYLADKNIDFNSEWSIKDLDCIEKEEVKVSKVGLSFEIFFSLVFLALINFMPSIVSSLENLFELSGLSLGHHINPIVFEKYLIFIAFIVIVEIIENIIFLINKDAKYLSLLTVFVAILNIGVLFSMIVDNSLYLNYKNVLGIQLIFIIVAVTTFAELISNSYKFIKNNFVIKQDEL